jgi:hypothetical protein
VIIVVKSSLKSKEDDKLMSVCKDCFIVIWMPSFISQGEEMKIGIIGSLGTVGQACYNGLIKHHEVVGYDLKNKELYENSEKNYQNLFGSEMVFVCLTDSNQ